MTTYIHMSQRDGSVGNNICHYVWEPELYPQESQGGKREQVPENCPLTTHVLQCVCTHTCVHAQQINIFQKYIYTDPVHEHS